MMEADSTTYDGSTNQVPTKVTEPSLPFNTLPGNLQLYKEITTSHGDQRLECQLVSRLQTFGLLPKVRKCPSQKPDCNVVCRTARVIDRVQWICEGCSKTQPIRAGSFFFRLQCSLLQTVQIILAWSEDADPNVAAAHFGIKPKVANQIFDSLDDIAIKEQRKCKLGGEKSVVLAEMYPDCVNRLSPDTTDQPHGHRILMLADTNHVPTSYRLRIIQADDKKTASGTPDTLALASEVVKVLRRAVLPGSVVLTGINVPPIAGISTVQQLMQHCDADMQHFLTTRIWRRAVTVCSASRSICSGGIPLGSCAPVVQRYLTTALYRLQHHDGFFSHVLATIASKYTDFCHS